MCYTWKWSIVQSAFDEWSISPYFCANATVGVGGVSFRVVRGQLEVTVIQCSVAKGRTDVACGRSIAS